MHRSCGRFYECVVSVLATAFLFAGFGCVSCVLAPVDLLQVMRRGWAGYAECYVAILGHLWGWMAIVCGVGF